MIACVDVGGTKTLLGVAEPGGERPEFTAITKIETPPSYEAFLDQIQSYIHGLDEKIDTLSLGYPGRVDARDRRLIKAQNLSWGEASVAQDLQERLPDLQHVFVENDGNLGGLAEATNGAGASPETVYYLTISTGIGGGYIVNGSIEPNIGNSEPGHMSFEDDGQLITWETIASGSAFFKAHDQTAAETNADSEKWPAYTRLLVPGFINIIALCNPSVIIVGGGIGAHFDVWWPHLERQLRENLPEFLELPAIKAAHHAEHAVLEGAYYYAKQNS